jgi:Flp pilus assembly protein protease CpaA
MAIHISYQLSPPWLLFDYSFSVIFFYLLCRVGLRDLFAVCSSNWPKTTVFFVVFVIYMYLPLVSSFTYITNSRYMVILAIVAWKLGLFKAPAKSLVLV